jgi:hypothetical protein
LSAPYPSPLVSFKMSNFEPFTLLRTPKTQLFQ